MLRDLVLAWNLRLVEAGGGVFHLIVKRSWLSRIGSEIGSDFGPSESVRTARKGRTNATLLL